MRVLTNNTALSYTIESALGTPGTTWKLLEPNDLKKWGATIKTEERNPINADRNRQEGAVTDMDSGVELDCDLTLEAWNDFCEGFLFAVFKGATVFQVTGVTSTGYTVASGGALPANYLVYARGFVNTANNGLKVVGAASTGTEIKTSGLVAETISNPTVTNASVSICGIQGASGDFKIDASQNFTTAALDFTALTGFTLLPGTWVFIGGSAAGNQFATAADRGPARINSVAATVLTLAKRSAVYTADTGVGKTIHLYFGRFCRNVAASSADYLERSFTFEAAFKNLQNPGPGDGYEYSRGNYCNMLELDLTLATLAKLSYGFVGQTTDNPTTSRLSGASTPGTPVAITGFATATALSTSSALGRLRITEVDETGLTTDIRDAKFKINNNVTGEKVLGNLGPKYLNVGDLEVDIEMELMFTEMNVVTAIRNYRTVTMDFLIANGDGGILYEIPSLKLTDGTKNLPLNESVTLKTTGQAIKDKTFGYSLGITVFPFIPAT
jgi:hypothetical protein